MSQKQQKIRVFAKQSLQYEPAPISAPTHRLIKNFVPAFNNLVPDNISSTDNREYALSPYPLALSRQAEMNSASSNFDGEITSMRENSADGLYAVLGVTNLGSVYSFNKGSSTDMGQPGGSSNSGNDVCVYAGTVVACGFSMGMYYASAVQASATWTSISGVGSPRFLEPFGGYLYYTKPSSTFDDRRLVGIVDSSWTASSGLDLGGTWFINDIRNVNEEWLAVFASPDSSAEAKNLHRMFLWNGQASDTYSVARELHGEYRGAAVRKTVLGIFIKRQHDLVFAQMVGTSIVEKKVFKNVTMIDNSIPRNSVAVHGEYYVIATSDGLLFFNPDTDESFFGYSPGNTAERVASVDDGSSMKTLYLVDGTDEEAQYWLPYVYSTDAVGEDAQYISNLLVAEGERMQIDAVEVVYNEAPPSSSDIIQVTLTSRDVLEDDAYNEDTITIKNTTANSTNANVSDVRAISGDIGRIASELEVQVDVTAATASWGLIVREIIIYYTPIKSQR